MLEEIGIVLKKTRKACNYNLRDLAKKTNLSSSYLSQIENGKVSPSLSSLVKIANALGTTIQGLFEEVSLANENPVIRKKDRKVISKIDNEVKISFLTNDLLSKMVEVVYAEFQVDAHTGHDAAIYERKGPVFLYVVKGKVQITLGEETYILGKGDSINMTSNAPHAVQNIHDTVSEVIFVVVPH